MATDRTNFENLAKSLTKISTFDSPAVSHGTKYESVAANQYYTITGRAVTQSGIVISRQYPYLGCSPDGLVGDDGIVEITCPFTAKNSLVNTDSVSYLYEDQHGIYFLDPTHEYYYQVQGTMLCTCRNWADFVVWTHCDMKVV